MPATMLDIAIDVSDNNDVRDWAAVRAAGIRIAFVKFMEQPGHAYQSGPVQAARAKAVGIAVVPYWFLRPLAAPQVKAAVKDFAARAALGPGQAFMLDWEGRANQTCTPPIAEEIGAELAAIASRKPTGYWGVPGSSPAAPTGAMLQWDRFVPRYPVKGANSFASLPIHCHQHPELYWKPGGDRALPQFGQYTAWGRVRGIEGVVDRSVAFFPDEERAVTWCSAAPAAPAA